MIRLTRLTDYGIVLLTRMAREDAVPVHAARDLAGGAGLPLPMVNKILKTLTRKGLLESHRGVKGGYSLTRSPGDISVLDVIDATEGPLAITQCSAVEGGGLRARGDVPARRHVAHDQRRHPVGPWGDQPGGDGPAGSDGGRYDPPSELPGECADLLLRRRPGEPE